MSDGKLIFVILLAFGALGFLGLGLTVGNLPGAPDWQSPALFGIAAYLGWLLWDILKHEIT